MTRKRGLGLGKYLYIFQEAIAMPDGLVPYAGKYNVLADSEEEARKQLPELKKNLGWALMSAQEAK